MSTEKRLKKVETRLRMLLQIERQKQKTAEETLVYLLTGGRARR